jgi:hypothetical protein
MELGREQETPRCRWVILVMVMEVRGFYLHNSGFHCFGWCFRL